MPDSTALSAHGLTSLLCHALDLVAARGARTCTFIGSDTPDLPVHEIVIGQHFASSGGEGEGDEGGEAGSGQCYICPALDGGYVLLTLPLPLLPPPPSQQQSHEALFSSVEWSSPRTLSSQVTALEREHWGGRRLRVHIGREQYTDMDEAGDLLCLLNSATSYVSEEESARLLASAGDVFAACAHRCVTATATESGRSDGSETKGSDESGSGSSSGIKEVAASFRFTCPPVHTLRALANIEMEKLKS
jgi:hypothetical protein